MTGAQREKLLERAQRGELERLHAVRAVVVHHSATPRSATLESIERHHVQVNGWAAIGYHHVIDGAGTLHVGRPLPLAGAHAPGRNGDTLGLCIIGDNTDPEQRWTLAQVQTAADFVEDLRRVFGPELEVHAHRDVRKTACPGMSRDELLTLLGISQ